MKALRLLIQSLKREVNATENSIDKILRYLLANSSLFILKTYFDGNSQELKSATIKNITDKMELIF